MEELCLTAQEVIENVVCNCNADKYSICGGLVVTRMVTG